MDPTRQTWTVAALVGTLAGLAPIVGSVVPTVGAAAITAWLLSTQIAAVRSLRSTAADATVRIEPERTHTDAGRPIPVTATVERPASAADTAVTVTYPTPPIAEPIPEADRRIELAPSETRASTTFDLQIPVSGQFRLPEPTWLVADPSGSVTETYSRGPTPAFHVVETASRDRHAGRAGVETGLVGEQTNGHAANGMFPDRLRPYEQTDPANRIDWNTTARLGEPYVRETTTQTSRTRQLIVDHRAKMGLGPPDESMGAFARDVALGVVATAQTTGDRLGLLTVGDDGVTTAAAPTNRPTGYAELRRRLRGLEPTPSEQPGSGIEVDHPRPAGRSQSDLPTDTAFGRTLEAFHTASTAGGSATTASTTERRPLVRAVQNTQPRAAGSHSTVIITDDTDRAELWAAVQAAVERAASVVVYLTPAVCFDADQPPYTTQASTRYRQFDQFRRRLDGLDSVTALEVAPGYRRAAVRSDQTAELDKPARDRSVPESADRSTARPPAATAAVSDGGTND